ncbi:hypothetical protein [Streptomyces sp. NPDC012746]|uniref:hypothetical protein n=1 Tax=Streptomyces sp. NPDC012746 TaxID=3364845 RepID=UPI0036A2E8D6
MSEAVDMIPVAPEHREGYKRDLYKHLNKGLISADGCDTRKEVILAEAVVAPQVAAGCKLTGGSWRSAYDGDRHRRGPPRHRSLIAVSAASNRSKADEDPAEWASLAACASYLMGERLCSVACCHAVTGQLPGSACVLGHRLPWGAVLSLGSSAALDTWDVG